MDKIELIIKEAEDMIMNYQAENGFSTIFDQLNWALGDIRDEVKKLNKIVNDDNKTES